MSGRSSRNKGKGGERELVKLLSDAGILAKRTGHYQVHKQGEQQDFGDIELSDFPNLHLEVKRAERLNIFKAIEQAENDAKGKVPVVMFRKNRGEWNVSIKLEIFIAILLTMNDIHRAEDVKFLLSHRGVGSMH